MIKLDKEQAEFTELQKAIIYKVRHGLVAEMEESMTITQKQLALFCKMRTYMMVAKGTAFAVSPDGLVVTCSHTVRKSKNLTLISEDGELFTPQVLYWDKELDLSLLKIKGKNLPYFKLATDLAAQGQVAICIGNPDPNDRTVKGKLEPTHYLPFHVSMGKVLGYVKGDKTTRVSLLGPMKHSCWTYWGHSGGPICNTNGELIGVHNSWDSTTGTRRAMTNLSVKLLLERYQSLRKKGEQFQLKDEERRAKTVQKRRA